MLAIFCAFEALLTTIASAKDPRTQTVPATMRAAHHRSHPQQQRLILRQDLFDRLNPNNLRSDWPSPPAQPASYEQTNSADGFRSPAVRNLRLGIVKRG